MKVRTNLTPGKHKKDTGYSKINLLSRKKKDKISIAKAEKENNSKLVFIKSKEKLINPDKSSDQVKMRRDDALMVSGGKKNGWKVMPTYKYKKNLANKK
jgi:hypothetical protein